MVLYLLVATLLTVEEARLVEDAAGALWLDAIAAGEGALTPPVKLEKDDTLPAVGDGCLIWTLVAVRLDRGCICLLEEVERTAAEVMTLDGLAPGCVFGLTEIKGC